MNRGNVQLFLDVLNKVKHQHFWERLRQKKPKNNNNKKLNQSMDDVKQ